MLKRSETARTARPKAPQLEPLDYKGTWMNVIPVFYLSTALDKAVCSLNNWSGDDLALSVPCLFSLQEKSRLPKLVRKNRKLRVLVVGSLLFINEFNSFLGGNAELWLKILHAMPFLFEQKSFSPEGTVGVQVLP